MPCAKSNITSSISPIDLESGYLTDGAINGFLQSIGDVSTRTLIDAAFKNSIYKSNKSTSINFAYMLLDITPAGFRCWILFHK